MRLRTRARLATTTLIVVSLVIAAIIGIRWLATTPRPNPTPSGPTPPADVITFAVPPTPGVAVAARYIADLDAINPAIAAGQFDTTVMRGLRQCASLLQFPDDWARQVNLTNERFTAPGHPHGFGIDTAARILDHTHARLCPGYPLPQTIPEPGAT